MDDMYLYGPIAQVLPVAVELGERLRVRCGQVLKPPKCEVAGHDMDGIRTFLASNPAYSDFGIACVKGLDPTTVQWGEGVGFCASGMPIGDSAYVDATLSKDTAKVRATIDNIVAKLGPRSAQGLSCLGIYCYQTLLQHHAQLIHPSILAPHLAPVDEKLLELVRAATGIDFGAEDPLTLERLRMPKSKYGGAMRELVDVSPAAWIGGLLLTLPKMIDSVDVKGVTTVGFMNSLAPLLGPGSFDHGNEETRFLTLTTSGSQVGTWFNEAWLAMQNEVLMNDGSPPEDGILAAPSAAAGTLPGGTLAKKAQKEITKQREGRRFSDMETSFNALALTNHLRQTFMNVNRTSQQFIGSWPSRSEVLGNTDFKYVNSKYFGTASVQCAAHVGVEVGSGRSKKPLDVYGIALETVVMPGDHFRKRHDTNKWNFDAWLGYCFVEHITEPLRLFTACISQRGAFMNQAARVRNGMMPDYCISFDPCPQELAEMKCCAGVSYFNARTVLDRCGGVEKRAAAIPSEYRRKARTADTKYNDWDFAADGLGPVETRLESFGTIRALVIGPRAETSKDVERFIDKCSEIGAERRWRRMGARSQVEAKAYIKFAMRRSIGVVAARANAKLVRERLGICLGRDGTTGANRRRRAKYFARKVDQEYFNWAAGAGAEGGAF
jgi:hypothetical protein